MNWENSVFIKVTNDWKPGICMRNENDEKMQPHKNEIKRVLIVL